MLYPAPVIHFEGEAGTPFEGMWVDVRKMRSMAEFRALTQNQYLADQMKFVAAYILKWNVEGLEEYTETEPADGGLPERPVTKVRQVVLPAPAESHEVLRVIDPEVYQWVFVKVLESFTWRADDPKAPSGQSATTPSGEPTTTTNDSTTPTPTDDASSADSETAKPARSRRKS